MTRRGGVTLVEVVVTLGVMATVALLSTASITSAQRMSAMARERELATNVVRSYLARMRQTYPAANSTDMTGFLNDATTPADDLARITSATSERSILKNFQALVLKTTDETGVSWTWAASSATAQMGMPPNVAYSPLATSLSPVSMTQVGTGASSYPFPYLLPSMTNVAGAAGFNPTRDLDGDGDATDANVLGSRLLFVPVLVQVTWTPSSGNLQSRQGISLYAVLGPQH